MEGQGIVIKGDSNTQGFSFVCPPMNIEGEPTSTHLPVLECRPEPDTDGLPMIMLQAVGFRVPAGFYKFELEAVNPAQSTTTPGKWTFGSYNRIAEYPGMSTPIDQGLESTGFVVNKPAEDARLMVIDEDQRTATNRDDRPGKPNQLIFGFKLRQKPANEGSLKLHGPRGFQFHEDCLSGVETSANKVFGPNTEKDWPNDYTPGLTNSNPRLVLVMALERISQYHLGLSVTICMSSGLRSSQTHKQPLRATNGPSITHQNLQIHS
jgi:hypothetical protein